MEYSTYVVGCAPNEYSFYFVPGAPERNLSAYSNIALGNANQTFGQNDSVKITNEKRAFNE